MKYYKHDLEDLVLVQKLSYLEIGRRYGVSDTFIKKMCRKFEIPLPVRSKFPEGFQPANKGTKRILKCINCGSEIKMFGKVYCSMECDQEYKKQEKYKDFLENNEKYCRGNYSPSIFKYQFLKEQSCKCAICEMENTWNGKSIVFVMDHIDGDASNNKRENLRLVCPNCDSQLDTYKSKNKNSARKERYLRNYKS